MESQIVKILGTYKPKGLHRIAKIGYGHLCLRDEKREYRRGNKKGQSETTLGAQEEDKRNKNTTQYVLDTTKRKQTQIT